MRSCIGAVAGIVVVLGIELLEHLRIDDPIGAVPVHAFAGIWGTLSLGLFATGKYGVPTADGADTSTVVKGLFYGGGVDQLKAQFIGSLACVHPRHRRRADHHVRHQADPGLVEPARSTRTASSKVSTSSSTARPPTTWSSATA